MKSANKKIEKMRRNPKDWRIEQLEVVAKSYGIRIRNQEVVM